MNTQVLVSLRGDLDCLKMSHFLGYKFNQYFKFEAGYKRFMLSDFLEVCRMTKKVNTKKLFKEVLDMDIDSPAYKTVIEQFCNVWGKPSTFVLEKKIGISKSKWWRVVSGKSDLTLIEFLKIIDVMTCKLDQFLEMTIDQKRFNLRQDEVSPILSFLKQYPESSLILTGIHLSEYLEANPSERLEVLSKITSINKNHLDELIPKMIAEGICFYNDDGIIKDSTYKIEFRKESSGVGKMLYSYISDKTKNAYLESKNIEDDKKAIFCTYKVAPVSKKSKEKIKAEITNAYKKICEIIESEDSLAAEDIVVLNQAILTL